MKVPKIFLPDKNLDKKVEELTEDYQEHVDRFEEEQKILDLMSKLNLNKGILYTSLDPLRFEHSNLPYEKVVCVGIACAKLFENFYRYRFNYKSKGAGIKWLEVVNTRYKKDSELLYQIVEDVMGYHKAQNNSIAGYQMKLNKYEMKFNNPLSKKDLMDAINNFYCKKFPYLGSKYKLFLNKVVYEGLTEDEFIHSNLPFKRIEVRWKNRKGL